jgi:uracil-DNA glycosylase
MQMELGLAAEEAVAPEVRVDRLMAWAPSTWRVAPDWQPLLARFLASEPAHKLGEFIRQRLAQGAVIYPPQPLRALELTPLAQVRVVIVGQDPYHGLGQAEGLAFSVAPGIKPPPSLRNIFKELARAGHRAAGSGQSMEGSLAAWARQGVLLLNTCLTVEDGQAGSHANQGWEALTGEIVMSVLKTSSPVVFMLWGAQAQKLVPVIEQFGGVAGGQEGGGRHRILTANHPSPLSALRPPQPFIGCGHFEQANVFLRQQECVPVVW